MKSGRALALVLGFAAFAVIGMSREPAASQDGDDDPIETFIVTSLADETGGSTACPDDARCTLRRAIETVNARPGTGSIVIAFDPATFPVANPASIRVRTPLPAVTRDRVRIEGGFQVVLDGTEIGVEADGLRVASDGAAVRGLAVRGFNRACLAVLGESVTVGGSRTALQGNHLDACRVGVEVTGAGATLLGNDIGFGSGTKEIPGVELGIVILAEGVTVGPPAADLDSANRVGNTAVAVVAGDDTGEAFGSITITHNVFGRGASGAAAPNAIAVQIRPPVAGALVGANEIANATIAGIQMTADAGASSVAGVTVRQNTYGRLGGLAIDIGADAVRDEADIGDVDAGPNGRRNAPVIDHATQAAIAGTAGSSCAGCTVELYVAEHIAGTALDYGRTPILGGVLTTGPDGGFRMEAPPVTPGTWVIATVTGLDGATSEFGPSARVGAGLLQCGNVTLARGWNHAGYFGSESVQLGASFLGGKVRAIYRLNDGGDTYLHWLADAPFARTLTSLEPGGSYWFLADETVTLQMGFALTIGLPAVLQPGWNDFVYFGPTIPVFDAAGAAVDSIVELYRYVNDGAAPGWRSWGAPGTPSWAREFQDLEACGTYAVRVSTATTLQPPQP